MHSDLFYVDIPLVPTNGDKPPEGNTNENIIGQLPFFLNGTDICHDNSFIPYVTTDKNKSKYFCTHVSNNKNDKGTLWILEKALSLILKIKETNPDLIWIIENKDELFAHHEYLWIKETSKLFKRNNFVILSAELDKSVSDGFVKSFPSTLNVYQYLHHNRFLIPSSYIESTQNRNIIKDKKILSSTRKYNPSRESFYKQLIGDSENILINDDNSFRYFGKTDRDNLSKTDVIEYWNSKYNFNHDKVSGDDMLWKEEAFYNELLSEYENYYFSIVHETFPKDLITYDPPSLKSEFSKWYKLQMGEKTLLPMTSKTIFFSNSLPNIEKKLNEIGIETFSYLFEEYDALTFDNRSDVLISICKKINNMSYSDIEELYNRKDVQSKLEKNYNYILHYKNKENCRNEHIEFLKTLHEN